MPQVPTEDRVCYVSSGCSLKKVVLTTEQTSVKPMTDLMYTVCKAGKLVRNTGSVTLATTKACLQLPGPRRPVVYEKESSCFHGTLPSVAET